MDTNSNPLRPTDAPTLVWLSCTLLLAGLLWQPVASGDNEVATRFAKSYALIVGIDSYTNPRWPKLSYAVKDARSLTDFVRSQGFDEVIELLDAQATRAEITYYLQDYLPGRLGKDDRLFVFFAGHGHTDTRGGNDFGYIVPVDGTDRTSSLISMQEIRAYSRRMGAARHQLFVFDSCYGGLVGTRAAAAVPPSIPRYLDEITNRQARQYITAGGAGEQVLDGGPGGHSYFTAYLLEGLAEAKADLNRDGIITFGEIGAYLVPRATNDYQTPTLGDLPGHALGEYVFRSSTDSARPLAPAPPPADDGPRGAPASDAKLTIWKVGSPHSGDLPSPAVPKGIQKRATELGLRLDVSTLKPDGFFARYARAFDSGSAPDLLVIDNYGHLNGIKTKIGDFKGIYQHPGVRDAVAFVEETLDDFGSGWQLLTRTSPNHKYALALATPPPHCGNALTQGFAVLDETERRTLEARVEQAVSAYLACDQSGYGDAADPDSLDDGCIGPPLAIRELEICPPSGNRNLAFVPIRASIDSAAKVGQATLLAIARQDTTANWGILALSNDPITQRLIPGLPKLARRFAKRSGDTKITPARLISADGSFPAPPSGQRFGEFVWQPSPQSILEIAEFNYGRASRLFVTADPGRSDAGRLSTGKLWSTRGPWQWRIWSIGPDGGVTLSSAHSFTH